MSTLTFSTEEDLVSFVVSHKETYKKVVEGVKQFIGEKIYEKVMEKYEDDKQRWGKITGMIIESIDLNALYDIVENTEKLNEKINEANDFYDKNLKEQMKQTDEKTENKDEVKTDEKTDEKPKNKDEVKTDDKTDDKKDDDDDEPEYHHNWDNDDTDVDESWLEREIPNMSSIVSSLQEEMNKQPIKDNNFFDNIDDDYKENDDYDENDDDTVNDTVEEDKKEEVKEEKKEEVKEEKKEEVKKEDEIKDNSSEEEEKKPMKKRYTKRLNFTYTQEQLDKIRSYKFTRDRDTQTKFYDLIDPFKGYRIPGTLLNFLVSQYNFTSHKGIPAAEMYEYLLKEFKEEVIYDIQNNCGFDFISFLEESLFYEDDGKAPAIRYSSYVNFMIKNANFTRIKGIEKFITDVEERNEDYKAHQLYKKKLEHKKKYKH